MNIEKFRIFGFRSVIDTGWLPFSSDRITVLVGQNESGKSSILEALFKALAPGEQITENDLRASGEAPAVHLKIKLDLEELEKALNKFPPHQVTAAIRHLKKSGFVEFYMKWDRQTLEGEYSIIDSSFEETIELADMDFERERAQLEAIEGITKLPEKIAQGIIATAPKAAEESKADTPAAPPAPVPALQPPLKLDCDEIAECVYERLPVATLFRHESSLLPNQVDIDYKKNAVSGPNFEAANNYLTVAGIVISELASDYRTITYRLNQANRTLNADFTKFWTQTIGRKKNSLLVATSNGMTKKRQEKLGFPTLLF